MMCTFYDNSCILSMFKYLDDDDELFMTEISGSQFKFVWGTVDEHIGIAMNDDVYAVLIPDGTYRVEGPIPNIIQIVISGLDRFALTDEDMFLIRKENDCNFKPFPLRTKGIYSPEDPFIQLAS
ncbi:unnamed protein product [Rhizopus stolonifer]